MMINSGLVVANSGLTWFDSDLIVVNTGFLDAECWLIAVMTN